MPIPCDLEHIIYKVKDMIYNLVPALFADLASTVKTIQLELTANAKLEAALKNKKALDMAKIIKHGMAVQMIVAPENMKTLVSSLVYQCIKTKKGKHTQSQFTKEAVKDARHKSLGGAHAPKTPPDKH
jgi:hypothetical protein